MADLLPSPMSWGRRRSYSGLVAHLPASVSLLSPALAVHGWVGGDEGKGVSFVTQEEQ